MHPEPVKVQRLHPGRYVTVGTTQPYRIERCGPGWTWGGFPWRWAHVDQHGRLMYHPCRSLIDGRRCVALREEELAKAAARREAAAGA